MMPMLKPCLSKVVVAEKSFAILTSFFAGNSGGPARNAVRSS
jgi:hypothetical protein